MHRSSADPAIRLVTAGTLAASVLSRDGREAGLAVAGPGEVLPCEPEIRTWPLEPSRSLRFPLAGFGDAVAKDPPGAGHVLDAHRRALATAHAALALAALGSAAQRLAWWLALLAARLGRPHPSGDPAERGVVLRVSITQEALARLVGVSRETANRGLQALSARGIVRPHAGRLLIGDLQALRAMAEL